MEDKGEKGMGIKNILTGRRTLAWTKKDNMPQPESNSIDFILSKKKKALFLVPANMHPCTPKTASLREF